MRTVPQQQVARGRRVSENLVIVMIDLSTKKETCLPVVAQFDGVATTEEMLRKEVADLNRTCGLHGKTMQKTKRYLAFRAEKLN